MIIPKRGRLVWMLGAACLTSNCQARQDTAQAMRPDDLSVRATAGSLVPGEENQVVEIVATGRGRFMRVDPSEPGPPLESVEFELSDSRLDSLWAAVEASEFFSLDSRYVAEGVDDGAFLMLTITADGRTHQVEVKNVAIPRLGDLVRAVNRMLPDGTRIEYSSLDPDG